MLNHPDLSLRLPLQGNPTDLSAYGHVGTAVGSPTYAAGVFGSELILNGSTQYITYPDHAALNATTKMSVSAWVKPGSAKTNSILSKGDNGAAATISYRMLLSTAHKLLVLVTSSGTVGAGTSKYYLSAEAGAINTPMHVGFTWDSGTLLLYVRGVQAVSPTKVYDAAFSSIHQNTEELTVGVYRFNGAVYLSDAFNGGLDEVQIYKGVAFSPADMLRIAQGFHPLGRS